MSVDDGDLTIHQAIVDIESAIADRDQLQQENS